MTPDTPIKHEKSCGAVIFKLQDGHPLYLTVEYKKEAGYWGLAKGHVEPGETEHQTARREIFEEVGLDTLTFIDGFRTEITYSPAPGVEKLVVFFLAQVPANHTPVKYLWDEHVAHQWLPYPQIAHQLIHNTDRSVVQEAHAFLNR